MAKPKAHPMIALHLRETLANIAAQTATRVRRYGDPGWSERSLAAMETLARGLPVTRFVELQASIRGIESWRLSDDARKRLGRQRIANALAHALLTTPELVSMIESDAVDRDGNQVAPTTREKDIHERRYSLRLLLIPVNEPKEHTDA